MASERRAADRRKARDEQRAQAMAQRVQQVDALGQHIQGYSVGFGDGYLQALNDLEADNVVKLVSTQILVVSHDGDEMARHVLRQFQKAMRPKSMDDFRAGVDRATQKYLKRRGLLPDFEEVADATG